MKILFLIKELQLFERMGIMYLSAVLKKNGCQVKLLRTFKLSLKEICKEVANYAPQILAYSSMTGEHRYYLDLNRKIRERLHIFSIFGGPHPTFFPEMINNEGVDCVCIGEGEGAIVELATKLQNGRDITNIKNLWVKRNGQVFRNPVRDLISNLDRLPFPDRELIYQARPDMRTHKAKLFFTGRGCPYSCTYCFNHQYNQIYKNRGTVVRFRKVDNVIQEITEVKEKYALRFVMFDDDTFLARPKSWLEEFAKKYRDNINSPFMCNVRPNLINRWVANLLKKAGCYSVWIGVECGDELISENLLKRNIKNDEIIRACQLLREARIKYATQNLIALPVPNPIEVDFKTLQLNIKCNPDFAWSSIFYPYPKTDLGEYSREKGYFRKSYDNMAETNKIISELIFKDIYTKKKLERLHKIFGVIVEFPFLFKLVNLLMRLPLDRFYKLLFFSWYGFCFKIRLEKWKKTPLEIYRLISSLFRYLRTIRPVKESLNLKEKDY